MRVVQRPVRAELAPFLRSIWLFEAELAHGRERILPAGASQLLVNLVDDELRAWRGDDLSRIGVVEGAALTGVTDEPFAIDTAQQRRIAGVAFRPGGARMFFALPMSEIRDRDLSLSALWGPAGTRLRLRMLEASDDSTRLALLEEALLAHLRPDRDRAMELAVAALERGQSVGSLARDLELSPRRLIRRFSDHVGLPPKRFARLRRFHGVLTAIAGQRAVNWAAVAQAAGYCDQAHLIRDFRAFSGLPPSRYRPRNARDTTHALLD